MPAIDCVGPSWKQGTVQCSALARVYLQPYTQEPLKATGHHMLVTFAYVGEM